MSEGPGALDGRLELRERIGAGGMGEIHLAWDRALQRPVAVKFVRGADPKDADRLLLEARLQARVEHPHVVRVHEVGSLGGRPCIVLQLVRGSGLDECGPRLPLAERVELLRHAALGLHAAHLQGLVHRDVKPGNLLVEELETGARTAFVTDFGLAHAEEGGLTRSGVLQGTLDFMSPEQIEGSRPIDFRTDVYALGATLYALLAGRPPFRVPGRDPGNDGEEQVQVLRRILDEEPPPLRSLAPQAAQDLCVIVAKAMEKDPGARYPSAEAFAEDLARFQRGEPILARLPGPGERFLKWARRNRAASRALAAALAVLVAAVGWGLWVSRRSGFEALEAARLGAQGARLQELMRLEQLLPPHDLRPAKEKVRAVVAGLQARPPAVAAATVAFTLGRGHQLLGDDVAAWTELTRAWELGFRQPEAAAALAEVEGRRYARELAALGRIDDPARRKARVEDLARRFRDPAVARLKGLAAGTELDRHLIAARLALVERRFADAAAEAAEGERAGADPVEAPALEGEARFLEAVDRWERGDVAGARAGLAQAAASLERAIDVARSAPAPRLLLARVRIVEYDVSVGEQGLRLPPLDAVAAQLTVAEKLDPDGVEVRNVWSGLERRRAGAISAAGGDALPAYRAAVEQGERAVAASATDPRQPLLQVANACVNLAEELASRGQDPSPAAERGIAAARRALALSPESSGAIFNLAQLEAFQARWLARRGEDARAAAAEAVADSRRFVALGDRPVTARVILGQALHSLGEARWRFGDDADSALAEGAAALQEGGRLAPGSASVLEKGVALAATWAELALAEGRPPEAALGAGLPWARALLPLTKSNLYYAAMAGALGVLQARGELLAGRDPGPALAEAAPLLAPTADRQAETRLALGEAELARAAWDALHGRGPGQALERAQDHARRAQGLDPRDAAAHLLEARALLAAPQPTPAALEQAAAAAERAAALDRRLGAAQLAAARARHALGDDARARTHLDRAAALQPRLAGLGELRAALGQAP